MQKLVMSAVLHSIWVVFENCKSEFELSTCVRSYITKEGRYLVMTSSILTKIVKFEHFSENFFNFRSCSFLGQLKRLLNSVFLTFQKHLLISEIEKTNSYKKSPYDVILMERWRHFATKLTVAKCSLKNFRIGMDKSQVLANKSSQKISMYKNAP